MGRPDEQEDSMEESNNNNDTNNNNNEKEEGEGKEKSITSTTTSTTTTTTPPASPCHSSREALALLCRFFALFQHMAPTDARQLQEHVLTSHYITLN